jgi:hypothetical protein
LTFKHTMKDIDTDNLGIYSIRSYKAEEGYEPFKIKVGEDYQLLIKMKSGAYLNVDSLGIY